MQWMMTTIGVVTDAAAIVVVAVIVAAVGAYYVENEVVDFFVVGAVAEHGVVGKAVALVVEAAVGLEV